MPPPDPDSPVEYSFALEVDGISIGRVLELSGLKLEQDVIEVKESGPDGKVTVRRLPGRALPVDLTLTRRLTADHTVEQWMAERPSGSGPSGGRNAAVVISDVDGHEVKRYLLRGVWPSKLEVGPLKAGESSVLMETFVLSCDSIEPG